MKVFCRREWSLWDDNTTWRVAWAAASSQNWRHCCCPQHFSNDLPVALSSNMTNQIIKNSSSNFNSRRFHWKFGIRKSRCFKINPKCLVIFKQCASLNCLKIPQMSHRNSWILAVPLVFSFKSDLSGNTVFTASFRFLKNSPISIVFGIFTELLSTVTVARFARNIEWDFSVIF